eukprot:TRINITY_DN11282_c1_g1_i2.p1 TRINITY_DN11282_c1_g1~~TRINITY_DN11282_c1_g1_i2.p1  ORF type:complete len:467 (+),score=125.32 TRINITY_DN11282_c1_g1_i2:45-1445(+)
MNEQVSLLLERQKLKKPDPKVDPPPEDRTSLVLQKELENAQKQIVQYQKEIKSLNQKLGASGSTPDRIIELENLLKDKSREIEMMKTEKKTLEKIKRDQEKTLESIIKDNDQTVKINQLNEELRVLKLKLKEHAEREKNTTKQATRQQEHMVALETKLRELKKDERDVLSDKLGEKRTTFPSIAKDARSASKTHSLKAVPKANTEANEDLPLTVENFESLKSKVKILTRAQATLEKRLQRDKEEFIAFKEQSAKEKEDLIRKLELKTMEYNTLKSKFNEIKRATSTLQKAPENPNVEYKDEEFGRTELEETNGFDDRELFPEFEKRKQLRLVGLKVWLEETKDFIAGVQGVYREGNGKLTNGKAHVLANKIDVKMKNFDLPEGDFIKKLGGSLTPNGDIQSLILESNSGKSFEFGNSTGKNFMLATASNEAPVLLHGGIIIERDKKTQEETVSRLVSIGAVIFKLD